MHEALGSVSSNSLKKEVIEPETEVSMNKEMASVSIRG
jgi:hypothetical protein